MSISIVDLLINENRLSKVARFYDNENRIITEYKATSDAIPNTSLCIKRSYLYNINDQIVGEQTKLETWTQELEDQVSPPITNITLSNNTLADGLPSGTKVADVIVTGGVAPFTIILTSNPGNLFRIDNDDELTLNAPSSSGSYPITIEVTDDDGKVESQNFSIEVTAFVNEKSYQFDGVDEYINCGTNNDIKFERTNAFSVGGWIKMGAIASASTIIGNFHTVTSPRGWRISAGITVSSSIAFHISNSGSNQIVVYTNSGFGGSVWHNFVVTYDGSSNASGVKIYVDNVLQAVTIQSNSLTLTTINNNNLTIASAVNILQLFPGNLDELSIWDKELNSTEIADIYNSGNPTNLLEHSAESNLLHYYRMGDTGTFPTIPDEQGLNNGTATNMEALDVKMDAP